MVYFLVLLLLSTFTLTQSLGTAALANLLKLNVSTPQTWQLLTSAISHHSIEHLAQNVFLVYVFGKVAETRHGAIALLLTFFGSAAGEDDCT